MNFTCFFIHVFSLHLYCHQGRCPHDDLCPICLLLGRQTYSLPRESRVLLQRAQIFTSTSAEETHYIKQCLLGQADGGLWILCQACVHFFFRLSGSIAAVWSTFARLLCFKSTLIVRNASFSLLNRGFLKMLISTEFLTEMSRQTKSYALWC